MSDDTFQLLTAIHAQVVRIADATCTSVPVVSSGHAYTRTQAARLLGVSVWSIDKGRKEGSLVEARRIGQRDVRIAAESLMTFMKKKEAASVRVRNL